MGAWPVVDLWLVVQARPAMRDLTGDGGQPVMGAPAA